MTVRLNEELELLHSYVAIHKERLGENLHVNIDIGTDELEKNIPPLSLQLLVENAIKHNIAGKENPLTIEIISDENSVTVRNNLQRKESSYSTRNGLKNLVQRYKILSEKEIVITQNNSTFAVQLPLL
jgi:LytS/YehU family sensor histidine kinase